MSVLHVFPVALIGYLIGSISTAVIIARSQGVNILKEGSGNPGATNVGRILGKQWAYLTFALDALKGFVATGWPLLAYENDQPLAMVGLIAAILGHSFSIFLKFRGGKGVATTIGGLPALMWEVLLIGLVIWLILFYTTKIVSLASVFFALSLPVSSLLIYGNDDLRTYLSLFLMILIVLCHRSNLTRTFSGKENTF